MPGLPFERLPAAIKMLDEQYTLGQRQLTQQFDDARFMLDQQELKPEEYNKAYERLLRQTERQGMQLYQQAQAQALFIQQLQELTEDGSLQPYQVTKIAYRMAGVSDPQMLRQLSGEPEQIDWRKAYRENVSIQRDLVKFSKNYTVEGDKLYQLDKPGGEIVDKKHPEGPDVVRHYNMTMNLIDYYRDQQQAIYTQLTPMEQGALEMERVTTEKMDDKFKFNPWKFARPFGLHRTASELVGGRLEAEGAPPTKQFLGRLMVGGLPGILGNEEGRKLAKEFLFGPKTPEPKTQEEYDALPIGTEYIDLDGIEKTKE